MRSVFYSCTLRGCEPGDGFTLPCFILCGSKVALLYSPGIELALCVNLKSRIRIYFRKRKQKESHI